MENQTSETARAITKGIKNKEIDDLKYNLSIFFSIIVAIILGVITKSWLVGIVTLLVCGYFAWKKWYKE